MPPCPGPRSIIFVKVWSTRSCHPHGYGVDQKGCLCGALLAWVFPLLWVASWVDAEETFNCLSLPEAALSELTLRKTKAEKLKRGHT